MSDRTKGGLKGFGEPGQGDRERGERDGRNGASGGRGGQRKCDCLKYKLLGKCDGKDTGECTLSHRNQVKSYSKVVKIPERISLRQAVGLKGENLKLMTSIAECYITGQITPGGKAEVEIVTSDEKKLPRLVETYNDLLSQLYPNGPQWCYLHLEGVSECLQDTLLHFQLYKGCTPSSISLRNRPLYELCKDEAQGTTFEMEKLIAKRPALAAPDTTEGAYQHLQEMHGASATNPTRDRRVHAMKVIKEYQDHMKEMLKGGLEWLCDNREGFVAKLEARYGKVLYKKLPEDVISGSGSWGIETFADIMFSGAPNLEWIFAADVRKEGADNIREMLRDDCCSCLETYDIKFMQSDGGRNGERLDVRVKFEDGQPKVLLVKKNETKTLVFDVICLHRNHDVRMTLNHYEVVKPEHPQYNTVSRLIGTLTLSNSDDCTITLVPKTEEWNVPFIRHKKKYTYVLEDKYMIAVSIIRECELDWSTAENDERLNVTSDRYKESHTEVEFYNIAWECAFGRDAGFSPEQSLALHMKKPTVEPSVGGAIPHPWQPEHILEDFKEVWEQLDTLNETLGSP